MHRRAELVRRESGIPGETVSDTPVYTQNDEPWKRWK